MRKAEDGDMQMCTCSCLGVDVRWPAGSGGTLKSTKECGSALALLWSALVVCCALDCVLAAEGVSGVRGLSSNDSVP